MKELKEALYSLLHNDATLIALTPGDVHDTLAPDDTAYPYVLFQLLGSATDWTLKQRVSEAFTLQIKAVDEGMDASNIESIRARLLALLDNQTLTVAGKTCWLCRCAGEIPDYAERHANGRTVMHGGLRFRVILA